MYILSRDVIPIEKQVANMEHEMETGFQKTGRLREYQYQFILPLKPQAPPPPRREVLISRNTVLIVIIGGGGGSSSHGSQNRSIA